MPPHHARHAIALHGLLVALLVFLAGPTLGGAARAAELEDLVAKLGEGGFAQLSQTVEEIAALGDPRALPAMEALAKGRLFTRKEDAKPVLAERSGDGYRLADPLTGDDLGEVGRRDVAPIRVNNLVRRAVSDSMPLMRLFSPDRSVRLAAAEEAARHPSPKMLEVLRTAIEAEQDDGVRAAMESSLLVSRLGSGTREQQLEAIEELSGSLAPQVRGLLRQISADPDADPEVREAANSAIESIERNLYFLELGLNLFQGVSLGSVLLLAAIGLAITFGVMGVINMAHGEMIMIGAYSTFVVQELFRAFFPPEMFGLYLLTALPVAFCVAAALGIALERSVIRWLYGRPLETLLATWGISLILQQLVRSIFGAPNKQVANPDWMTGGVEIIGGYVLTYNRLYIILFCFAVFAAVVLVLRYTSFGLHMRAVTQNRSMARTMGINSDRIDALTFGLGSGIAGIGGVALSQIGNVSPNLGQLYIVDSFMVVVFGGVGNLAGTLVGAMTLGIVNKFLEPVAGAVLGKVVVLVLIILFIQRRPRGLFALKGRAAES